MPLNPERQRGGVVAEEKERKNWDYRPGRERMRATGRLMWGRKTLVGFPSSAISVRCPKCCSHASLEPGFEVLTEEQKLLLGRTKGRFVKWGAQSYIHERFPGVLGWSDSDSPMRDASFLRTVRIIGVLCCSCCASRRKHVLDWPTDAYYRVEVAGGLIWAWDRQHVIRLVNYLSAEHLEPSVGWFLRHIPKCFLLKRNRGKVVKALGALLATS